ncbi:hypothetical protein LY78DRAFT_304637 [Colletotrichum sublineola]|nr:hypothetical protein LY78DRAFT_304637 [Colletotrichum sublineola]
MNCRCSLFATQPGIVWNRGEAEMLKSSLPRLLRPKGTSDSGCSLATTALAGTEDDMHIAAVGTSPSVPLGRTRLAYQKSQDPLTGSEVRRESGVVTRRYHCKPSSVRIPPHPCQLWKCLPCLRSEGMHYSSPPASCPSTPGSVVSTCEPHCRFCVEMPNYTGHTQGSSRDATHDRLRYLS